MSIERNIVISLLKLTKEGPVLTELVKREAHVTYETMEKLLAKLQNEGLVYREQGCVDVEAGSRLKLAIRAISLGADFENVTNLLRWQEFEEIAGYALKNNGYNVSSNVRFKQASRKWEIDLVGCRKPIVICIDCKRWLHAIAPSALRKIVDSQIERTRALASLLPDPALKLECAKWNNARFVPAVLSLLPSAFKFYSRVPVVPILQLQDYLNQMHAYTQNLRLINKTFSSLSHNLQN